MRCNLKTDPDSEVYRDLYGHSRKVANISLRLTIKENKNVQLNHNRLLYYEANYEKITTKSRTFMYILFLPRVAAEIF